MRVGFHTFGCKLNQFETEALADSARAAGHTVVTVKDEADVYVINTCTVTARADHKARSLIRAVSRNRPRALVIATGCSAQLEHDRLGALGRNVRVVPQSDKALLLDLSRLLSDAKPPVLSPASFPDPFLFNARRTSFHTRAFLKIQDGCDAHCAYCRVPLARGRSVSLDTPEVLKRAAALESAGYREIVITGVNISAYRSGDADLAQLLRYWLDEHGRARLRLSSLEPESVTERLADVLRHERICPHFHLPVQSGSDRILRAMRRRYDNAQVAQAVKLLRAGKEDPFLAADVLVGFPGETADDFGLTRALLEDLAFSALHVFPFSPRGGTTAASLPNQVPEQDRMVRAHELGKLSAALSREYARRWVGREVDVLVERGGKSGFPAGLTANYLKVALRGTPREDTIAGKRVSAVLTSVPSQDAPACEASFLHSLD